MRIFDKFRWWSRLGGHLIPVSVLGLFCLTVSEVSGGIVIATIPVAGRPSSPVVSPDSKFVYVACTDSTIAVIDTATNQVASTISVTGYPSKLAITPDGSTLYCAENGSNMVLLISTSTKQVTGSFATGSSPFKPAISPDGTLVYIPNNLDGTVTVISKGALQSPIVVQGNPVAVAFTPDGSHAFVSNQGFIASENYNYFVSEIDTATGKIVSVLASPQVPYPWAGMAVSPDGTKIYMSALDVGQDSAAIAVIDTGSNTLSDVILCTTKRTVHSGDPAITPDGTLLYVPFLTVGGRADDLVVRINLSTNSRFGSGITVGTAPSAVAVAPNGKRAYVTNSASNSVTVLK